MKQIFNVVFAILVSLISGCCSGSPNDSDKVVIGGFRFGAHKEEILQVAKSLNYDIVPCGDYRLFLKGDINALGMSWNEMRIIFNDKIGIREIHLIRPLDSVSQAMIDAHYTALLEIFPNAQKLRLKYHL